jgi:hypothetical protein
MGFFDRFNKVVRIVGDRQQTITQKNAVVLAGTTKPIPGILHKSTQLEQDAIGRMGNDYPAPSTPETFELGADWKRYQDFANSHLNEGPTPGRIPRPFQARASGKLGDEISGTPAGTIGFKLGISGNDAGGIGSAMYIPHTNVIRGAGHVSGALRTIDDGAQVPGVYVADPTRS